MRQAFIEALPLAARVEAVATAFLARAWPDFVAVHMTWGAINELTTLTGYQRIAEVGKQVRGEIKDQVA